jgi:integrase
VADRLGHADPSVTLRVYTANSDAQAQAAADSLEAGLEWPELGPG